jgi:aryl-alcohol dehydrogenase-like predicted oxidoreductase
MSDTSSAIPTRRLGGSGLAVTVVGLGTNNFGRKIDLAASRAVIDTALDEGINLFDTADIYGASEEIIGEVLEGRRDQVVLATKFGMDLGGALGPDWGARGSRRYIRLAVERSLRRLRTDWIDLYQIHRPDPATPIEETLGALTELVYEGKVRYIGSSNYSGWQLTEAEWAARATGSERFISAQNLYSWLERDVEKELVPAALQYDVGILPFFPLASGLLTGKYHRGQPAPDGSRIKAQGREDQLTDARFDIIEKLEAFAAERGVTLLDVAMGGLAAQPGVASVITGAPTPEQVKANVRAGAWGPTAEDREMLDLLARPAQS